MVNDRPAGANSAGSVSGKSVRMEGEIFAGEPLSIFGEFKGKIEVPAHAVFIAEGANVEADISAETVKVSGRVRGAVTGSKRAEVTSTADISGTLVTRELRVEEGAIFRGQVDRLPEE